MSIEALKRTVFAKASLEKDKIDHPHSTAMEQHRNVEKMANRETAEEKFKLVTNDSEAKAGSKINLSKQPNY